MDPAPQADLRDAAALMTRFAERTGLGSDAPPRRYLWTDAFAVCNFLGLARATGDDRYHTLALLLVDQVHRVLGQHRPDDPRTGWISGLDPEEGARHPTRGGLRIGKPLPERGPDEPLDDRLEWDRDGQYFHYLTKWMVALDHTSRVLQRPELAVWARELADTAHRAFTFGPPGQRRMVWKASIDLSRPLVPAMGQHDPLDGFVTAVRLQTTARTFGDPSVDLDAVVADYATLLGGLDPVTADPLGLGGLLVDARQVGELTRLGAIHSDSLLQTLLGATLQGLSQYVRRGDLSLPASRRLAFRELGLAIGLAAVEPLDALQPYRALGPAITSFWRAPGPRESPTWTGHADINDVMLATALLPAS